MKWLLRRASSMLLPVAITVGLLYDVGGVRTALEANLTQKVTTARTDVAASRPAASPTAIPVAEVLVYDKRKYWLSAAPVAAKALGRAVAEDVRPDQHKVTVREVKGFDARHLIAVRVVAPGKKNKTSAAWYLAAVQRPPATSSVTVP